MVVIIRIDLTNLIVLCSMGFIKLGRDCGHMRILNFQAVQPKRFILQINGIRIPAYHRLDLGVRYNWGKGNVAQDLTIGIQNVYDRQNIYYLYDIEDPDFPEANGRQTRNGLPALPTLSYRVKFGL